VASLPAPGLPQAAQRPVPLYGVRLRLLALWRLALHYRYLQMNPKTGKQMTALNIVRQPQHKQILVLSDGASYLPDGQMIGTASKIYPVPSWPGIVAGRGPSLAPALLGQHLALAFPTWDSMVQLVEDALPAMVDACAVLMQSGTIELVLAGWSQERERPETYLIRCDDELPPGATQADVDALIADGGIYPGAFELCELPAVVCGPMIGHEAKQVTGYTGIAEHGSSVAALADMRLALETQRHDPTLPFCCVGGFALLTTITPDKINQEIVHRWSEDQIGELIEPAPINDWAAWRAALSTAEIPTGLSRLQRERMEKKARKGTLRAA
jgi:hypothetical protein